MKKKYVSPKMSALHGPKGFFPALAVAAEGVAAGVSMGLAAKLARRASPDEKSQNKLSPVMD